MTEDTRSDSGTGLPKVLIIDDEPGNRRMMAGVLEDEFELVTAADGEEGLSRLAGDLSVILCDERMPGMSGIEVLRKARSKFEDVSRVLVTAYPDRRVLSGAINEGGVRRYLEKPFAPNELLALVRQEVSYVHLVRDDARRAEELLIRNRIAEVFLATSGEEMFSDLLKIVLDAVHGEHGILGYLSEEGELVFPTIVQRRGQRFKVSERSLVLSHNRWEGIWGEALTEREARSSVEPVDLPGSSDTFRSALSVPITHRGKVIGNLTVGSDITEYGMKETELLGTLAAAIAPVLQARLERDRQERARQREEEARLALEKQIQQAQKLESLGVLAGGIAHDFNNILTGVLGNASLAMAQLPPDSPVREDIEQVEKAARWAAELTQQMLAYSGRGRFVVEPLDLARVVGEMAPLLDSAISKKAVRRFDFAPDLPPVIADSAQVRQLLMNLITNASDAIGSENGAITVKTDLLHADREYLAGTFMDWDLEEGAYVRVEVSDTGCGMDEETRSKIFDPFFSTKFTGRGLGLAAVLGIVRGHKGALKVYSEPGKGTNITVLFPAGAEGERHPLPAARSAGDWRGEGLVMVVDDEEVVRRTASAALERLGFEVIVAADGCEALTLIEARGREVQLVLLDMTMPKMDGLETFLELKRIDPDLKVILSSGYNEQEATNRFTGEGLAGFIQKPYSSKKLAELIRGVLKE